VGLGVPVGCDVPIGDGEITGVVFGVGVGVAVGVAGGVGLGLVVGGGVVGAGRADVVGCTCWVSPVVPAAGGLTIT
jgi:hypothetical protein